MTFDDNGIIDFAKSYKYSLKSVKWKEVFNKISDMKL